MADRLNQGDVVRPVRPLSVEECIDADRRPYCVAGDATSTPHIPSDPRPAVVFGCHAGLYLGTRYVPSYDHRVGGRVQRLMHLFFFGRDVFIDPRLVELVARLDDVEPEAAPDEGAR